VGPAYGRPLRIHAKRSTPTIQRPLEGPQIRGRRQPPPTGRFLAARKQLMQPPMVRPTGAGRQTVSIPSRCYSHRPLLAEPNVVPRFGPPRPHNVALPSDTRFVLSRHARQARGGRTSRMEHRGFSTVTPS
jgi:hypothetical protein